MAEPITLTKPRHHLANEFRGTLKVVRCASRDNAMEDYFFRRAPTHHHGDLVFKVRPRHEVSALVRSARDATNTTSGQRKGNRPRGTATDTSYVSRWVFTSYLDRASAASALFKSRSDLLVLNLMVLL